MVMTTGHKTFAGMPPVRVGAGPNRRHLSGAAKPAPRREASAQPSLLQLTIDAVGQLVESFIDGDLLCDHLLQGSRPFGRQIKEQRLRREVDLRAGRRDVMLLEIPGI